jgi:hypothetical protein
MAPSKRKAKRKGPEAGADEETLNAIRAQRIEGRKQSVCRSLKYHVMKCFIAKLDARSEHIQDYELLGQKLENGSFKMTGD